MANPTVTNIDLGELFQGGEEFRDELLTLAGADEIAKGTILARDTTTGKLVLFVKGGVVQGNGIPHSVLSHHVSATGAGDSPVRVAIKGTVNKKRLIIDTDGDDSNIDGPVIDQLRDFGITPIEVSQHSVLDNQ